MYDRMCIQNCFRICWINSRRDEKCNGMNYENHNNIIAAISIFTQQESQILGNSFQPSEKEEKQEWGRYILKAQ